MSGFGSSETELNMAGSFSSSRRLISNHLLVQVSRQGRDILTDECLFTLPISSSMLNVLHIKV
jgi:hypothetical protein